MNDRKRILIFGWADSVHVQRWCRGLQKRGYQIKLVSIVGPPIDGVDTTVLPRSGKLSYFTQCGKAVAAARAFKPNLVHVHYAAGNGLWGLKLGHNPTVLSVWGSDVEPGAGNMLIRHYVKSALKAATSITATSEYLKHRVTDSFGIDDISVSVIPFGVSIPDTAEPPPADPINLCYVKNHRHVYGLDILVEAMADVVKEAPDVILNVAGEENEYTQKIKRTIARYGLEKNVQFVGQIPNEEVISFIRRNHIMVMPSRAEAFGVAAVEAAATGRPVIASDVGGVSEVVLNDRTGLLVPPRDPANLAEAIIKLARDANLRHKMGEQGYRFAKDRYSWDHSLDMMTELYERLIYDAQEDQN
jgi:glycosyltransferase involved in cell wall biosynthesis